MNNVFYIIMIIETKKEPKPKKHNIISLYNYVCLWRKAYNPFFLQ